MGQEQTPFGRFKRYEACYNILIPPRTYTIVRVDGRAFSKFTKKMNKPFDIGFSEAMNAATVAVCEEFNPKLAYVQSDEISFLFSDLDVDSQQIFDGKVQKLVSLIAAKATIAFNNQLLVNDAILHMAHGSAETFLSDVLSGQGLYNREFDARVLVIPDFREVGNYFVHRQTDATRNSISMAADAYYSHKELHGKTKQEKMDMLMDKGVNWNNYPVKEKRGLLFTKQTYTKLGPNGEEVIRKKWAAEETPIFTQSRDFLNSLIPSIQFSDDKDE